MSAACGTNNAYVSGCRCECCRAAHASYARQRQARLRSVGGNLAAGDTRHGTVNGYSNHACRCEPCKTAWAAYCRNRRAERVLTDDDPRHGRYTTYGNYGCRCERCTEAWWIYWRKPAKADR